MIRNDDQAAGLARAMGVARTNHANDIPVANIAARSRVGVATINNRDNIPVANIRAAAARDAAGIKVNGLAPGFDAIQRAFPDAIENSGPRTPEHNRAVGGVDNSYHVPSNHPGAQAYDISPQPGMTIEAARAKIEAANPGVRVVEALQHDAGSGLHWHFALQGSGRAGKASAAEKPPKGISPASDAMLKAELKDQAKAGGYNLVGNSEAVIRARAGFYYKRDGNGPDAVRRALADGVADSRGAGGGAGDDLRAQANEAIGRGADPVAIAKRFRELNGTDFASTGSTFTMADARRTATVHNVPLAQVLENLKAAGQRPQEAKPGGATRVRKPQEANALAKGTRYTRPDGVEMIR